MQQDVWHSQIMDVVEGNRSTSALSEAMFLEAMFLLQNWNEQGCQGTLEQHGGLGEAMRLLMRAQSFNEQDVRPLLARAWIFLKLRDFTLSNHYLDRAANIDPAHPMLIGFLLRHPEVIRQHNC